MDLVESVRWEGRFLKGRMTAFGAMFVLIFFPSMAVQIYRYREGGLTIRWTLYMASISAISGPWESP